MPARLSKRKHFHESEPEPAPPPPLPRPPTASEPGTRRATRQTPIPPPPIPNHTSPRRPPPENAEASAASPVKRGRGRPPKSRPGAVDARDPDKGGSTATDDNSEPAPIRTKRAAAATTTTTAATAHQPQPQIQSQSPSQSQSAGRDQQRLQTQTQPATETRVTRQRGGNSSSNAMAVDARTPQQQQQQAPKEAKENVRPVNGGLVAPQITYQAPQPQSQPWTRRLMRPSPPTNLPPSLHQQQPQQQPQQQQEEEGQQHRYADKDKIQHASRPESKSTTQQQNAAAPVSSTPVPVPTIPPHTPRSQPHVQPPGSSSQDQSRKRESPMKPPPRADRNIDKVVLGDICFRTWYPSYYGKELLGDVSGSHSLRSAQAVAAPVRQSNGGKPLGRRGADAPMLDRLYVCPLCFKYSKELVAWLHHVRVCERARTTPPGRKVYAHPRGRRSVKKPAPLNWGMGRRPSGYHQTVEEVKDEGEWSIWEVDGEQEGLFCQNLSLFAKLFLDNKSVFFDVTGFNYFLLVYTPPAAADTTPSTDAATNATPPRPHIVGFFSKEKMSWDNNNLACILVFPPWQRKGLGALLMGVSYEISRREGVLGGPEKPISELGRKGYRRFWAAEVAKWLLSVPLPEGAPEALVDVNDCSVGTWIAVEDCLCTLREMGLVEDAGSGPNTRSRGSEGGEGDGEGDVKMGDADGGQGQAGKHEQISGVPRVRIDKEAVRRWVEENGISLEQACYPGGFVEGYAVKAGSPKSTES